MIADGQLGRGAQAAPFLLHWSLLLWAQLCPGERAIVNAGASLLLTYALVVSTLEGGQAGAQGSAARLALRCCSIWEHAHSSSPSSKHHQLAGAAGGQVLHD